jgi:hypothetical protein
MPERFIKPVNQWMQTQAPEELTYLRLLAL